MSKAKRRGVPYLPLYADSPDHPKLFELARILDLEEYAVHGLVSCMWARALRQAPDGRIRSPALLQRLTGWTGDAMRLQDALLSVGYLQKDGAGDVRIHNWESTGGESLARVQRLISNFKGRKGALESGSAAIADGNSGPQKGAAIAAAIGEPLAAAIASSSSSYSSDPDLGYGGLGERGPPEQPDVSTVEEPAKRLPWTPRPDTIHGQIEAGARPKTPDEFLERHADEVRQRFPSLCRSRTVLFQAVASRWDKFEARARERGNENARYALFEWLEDPEAQQARKLRLEQSARAGPGYVDHEAIQDDALQRMRESDERRRKRAAEYEDG
jgi:hypothetical protein